MSENDDRISREGEIEEAYCGALNEKQSQLWADGQKAKRINRDAPWGGHFSKDKPREIDIILQPGKC